MPLSPTSQVLVPLQRPVPSYSGRHRAPEPTQPIGEAVAPGPAVDLCRPVGEGTRDRRPNTLNDWEGETRQLTYDAVTARRVRAVWGAR